MLSAFSSFLCCGGAYKGPKQNNLTENLQRKKINQSYNQEDEQPYEDEHNFTLQDENNPKT